MPCLDYCTDFTSNLENSCKRAAQYLCSKVRRDIASGAPLVKEELRWFDDHLLYDILITRKTELYPVEKKLEEDEALRSRVQEELERIARKEHDEGLGNQ